jgi:hypothetical protein
MIGSQGLEQTVFDYPAAVLTKQQQGWQIPDFPTIQFDGP